MNKSNQPPRRAKVKVKELMKILKDLPQNYEVVMSSDGEGNNFSPLADFGLQMYIPDTTWSGEIHEEEDCEEGEYKENAVTLWPTN